VSALMRAVDGSNAGSKPAVAAEIRRLPAMTAVQLPPPQTDDEGEPYYRVRMLATTPCHAGR
jgi:hypothetical protein